MTDTSSNPARIRRTAVILVALLEQDLADAAVYPRHRPHQQRHLLFVVEQLHQEVARREDPHGQAGLVGELDVHPEELRPGVLVFLRLGRVERS